MFAVSYGTHIGDTMSKVVIFNSYANSGKDFICDYLSNTYGFNHLRFKTKLVSLIIDFYNLSLFDIESLSSREYKEAPSPKLNGMSWRQALIHMSEVVVKPNFGKSFFGDSLVEEVIRTGWCSVISDGGFYEEITPIIEAVGIENVIIIKIHCDGCSFEGDSREFLDIDGVTTYNVTNNKDEQFIIDVEKILMVENIISNEVIK